MWHGRLTVLPRSSIGLAGVMLSLPTSEPARFARLTNRLGADNHMSRRAFWPPSQSHSTHGNRLVWTSLLAYPHPVHDVLTRFLQSFAEKAKCAYLFHAILRCRRKQRLTSFSVWWWPFTACRARSCLTETLVSLLVSGRHCSPAWVQNFAQPPHSTLRAMARRNTSTKWSKGSCGHIRFNVARTGIFGCPTRSTS